MVRAELTQNCQFAFSRTVNALWVMPFPLSFCQLDVAPLVDNVHERGKAVLEEVASPVEKRGFKNRKRYSQGDQESFDYQSGSLTCSRSWFR